MKSSGWVRWWRPGSSRHRAHSSSSATSAPLLTRCIIRDHALNRWKQKSLVREILGPSTNNGGSLPKAPTQTSLPPIANARTSPHIHRGPSVLFTSHPSNLPIAYMYYYSIQPVYSLIPTYPRKSLPVTLHVGVLLRKEHVAFRELTDQSGSGSQLGHILIKKHGHFL